MYEIIARKLKKNSLLVLTVVNGKHVREKLIVCQNQIVYESRENGFLKKNLDKIMSDKTKSLITIDDETIFCDHIGSERQLVICGGGHVAIPVIRIGNMLGFHTVVLEDRPVFADHARRAGAKEVFCENFADGLKKVEDTSNTYYVIVTRGHRYDALCLENILKMNHAYIGMMGSRTRVAKVMDSLEEKGFERKKLDQVHSPIGLNIGAQTPEEIAVSIMAEIVSAKCIQKRDDSFTEELLERLLEARNTGEKAVLATIISREGSAPREVGTKMLVTADSCVTGTIGGGCIEAAAYQRCIRMLKDSSEESRIMKIDMSGEEAHEIGMVCGGRIEVFIETV